YQMKNPIEGLCGLGDPYHFISLIYCYLNNQHSKIETFEYNNELYTGIRKGFYVRGRMSENVGEPTLLVIASSVAKPKIPVQSIWVTERRGRVDYRRLNRGNILNHQNYPET